MIDLVWANVFTGPEAAGNATGVVVEREELDAGARWRLARALRAPDTVFVDLRGEGAQVRFFSPYEGEMALCGQGLVAADGALRQLALVSADDPIRMETAVGPIRTWRDPGTCRSWFEVSGERVRAVGDAAPASTYLPGFRGTARVVDSGRPRLFVDTAELETSDIPPVRVMGVCQANELSGLCLYHRQADGRVRLRVFTVSLAGAEDAATGGAVLGLAALLDPGETGIEVRQGLGHLLRRGRLFLRRDPGSGRVAVGGDVALVAEGHVLRC